MTRKLVVVETPFMGDVERNVKYTRACLRDCLVNHNEYPFASHLLYTQTGVLNDNNPEERALGIEAGLCWVEFADLTAVYTDLGISTGMRGGIDRALKSGREIIYRTLGENWEIEHSKLISEISNHPFIIKKVGM